MRSGAIRAALMLLAGLGLAMAALLLIAPPAALAGTPHAHHGHADHDHADHDHAGHGGAAADAADRPATAPAPAPGHPNSHDKACCTVAACPLMHIALPAVWVAGPRAVVGVPEPVRAMPAPRGLDRPPPLPPPRPTV